MNTPPEIPPPVAEDRTVAILAYLTLIGFIVAVIMHGNKKTALGAYHLRQCLGLFVTAVVFGVAMMMLAVIPIIGAIVGFLAMPAAGLCFFVLWVMGLMAAANGQQKPMPVVGEQFQKWFGNAFG
ncbi:membrane protein [Verrucomicrobiota bacterium]|nr:membrane protein [Verrucomicrobiota bacterium]